MNLGVTGIVINGFNQILLIKRNDTHTWAAPAGGMEAGELPTDTVKREVQEETGLKVMPVRMVSINFTRLPRKRSFLQFTYRCMEAGGEIATSEESLEVGFVKTQELPKNMMGFNRETIQEAIRHTGDVVLTDRGTPWRLLPRYLWLKLVVYPRFDRQRKAKGERAYVPAPDFQVSAAVAVRDSQNNLVWVKTDGGSHLPMGACRETVAPWDSAAEIATAALNRPVTITRPIAVYIDQKSAKACLLWEGMMQGNDGVEEVPADADEQSARFAQMALQNNSLVQTEFL